MATDELFVTVAERMRRAELPFAVIGAVAMSIHGFPRQTFDFNLFTADRDALDESLWHGLPRPAEVRRGEVDDPLAGFVRFHGPEVDVVVGRYGWQADIVHHVEARLPQLDPKRTISGDWCEAATDSQAQASFRRRR